MAMAMKDELIDLLRDRFSGHELEVPNGVWENVSSELAASASGESLREALQDKFQAHEVDVDPSAWSNISAQLGHGAAAGTAFSTAWIAAGITAVAITAGLIFLNTRETTAPMATDPIETVTHQPVAVLPASPKTTPEPASITLETPTRQEPAKAKKDAHEQTSSGVVNQQVQQASAPVQAQVRNAPPSVVKTMEGSNTVPGPSIPATVPQPQAPATQKTVAPTSVETAGTKSSVPSVEPGHSERPGAPSPSDTTSSRTAVLPGPLFDQEDSFNLFIPNVMTPNGDGWNDVLVITAGEHLKAMVRIYSKNGSIIFQANDLSQNWDGTLPSGNIAEEGYYNCIVQVTDPQGGQHAKKEVIRLYR